MSKKTSIICIVLFLALIYSVPVVQTVYEYGSNSGHRIQILDLPADILITPSQKADADKAHFDTLLRCIDTLASRFKERVPDSLKSMAAEMCEQQFETAGAALASLKQNVVNYNRHLGQKSRYAAIDTVTPYYHGLKAAEKELAAIRNRFDEGCGSDTLAAEASALSASIAEITPPYGKKSGLARYFRLTLTALNRTMVGADYLRPFEKEMEKASVFAIAIRPWIQTGYYAAFGDLGSKGLAGKTAPWLFYRPDVDYLVKPPVTDKRSKTVDANDTPVKDDIVDTIVAFRNRLAKQDINLLFVIIPTKASIYPGVLAPGMNPFQSEDRPNSLIMIDSLRAAGVDVVDLFSAFIREQANDAAAGDSLFLAMDTHFKNRGVLTAAAAVAARIRKYPWFRPGSTLYVSDTVTVGRAGDIADMCGLPDMNKRLGRRALPPEPTLCNRVYALSRDDTGAETGRIPYRDDYRGASILVLGDSYSRIFQTDQPKSAGWIAHLARELQMPLASIVNDGGASTLVRQALARKPHLLKNKKLVVWEVVERDLRFGEEGWKNVAF